MRVFAFFCSDILIRVLFSRKSDKAFSINVNSKRLKAGDDNVETKIKLITIKKKWVVDVSRDYTLLGSIYFFQSAGEVNTSAT